MTSHQETEPFEVGEFRLDAHVGHGGFADVWRGVHRRTLTPVALKVLRDSADTKRMAGFRREIRTVASFDHPNLLEILDAGVVSGEESAACPAHLSSGQPWFAMPFIGGGTLFEHLDARLDERINWLVGLAQGLSHAHARKVLHLDVKPHNVLVRQDLGRKIPVLTDFGIARLVGSRRGGGLVAGTPGYLAPEQLLGEPLLLDVRTDLFAFGLTSYEILTGERARDVTTADDLWACIFDEDPDRWVEGVIQPLRTWMSRLVATDPAERYPSAANAAYALSVVLTQLDDQTRSLRLASSSIVEQVTNMGHAVAAAFSTTQTVLTLPKEAEPRLEPLRTPVPSRDELVEESFREHEGPGFSPLPVGAFPPDETFRKDRPQIARGTGTAMVRTPRMLGMPSIRAGLWSALRAVRETAKPRRVHLVGRPRSGRTRVLHWLRESVVEAGVAIPFFIEVANVLPLASAARATLSVSDAQSPFIAEVTRRWLERFGVEDAEVTRLFAGLATDPEFAAQRMDSVRLASSEERRAAFRTCVERIARQWPVVVLLDDLDLEPLPWEPYAEELREIDAPLLIVSASEDRIEGVEQLELGTMPDVDLRRLLSEMGQFEAGTADALIEGAHGQAGLLVESVRHYLRIGALEPRAQGLYGRDLGKAGRTPARTAELVRALNRVAATTTHAAQVDAVWGAALLGRWFTCARWKALTSNLDEASRNALLLEFASEGLLVRDGGSWRWQDVGVEIMTARHLAGEPMGLARVAAVVDVLTGERSDDPEPLIAASRLWDAIGSKKAAYRTMLAALDVALAASRHRDVARILSTAEDKSAAGAEDQLRFDVLGLYLRRAELIVSSDTSLDWDGVRERLVGAPDELWAWFHVASARQHLIDAEFELARTQLDAARARARLSPRSSLQWHLFLAEVIHGGFTADPPMRREIMRELAQRTQQETNIFRRFELLSSALRFGFVDEGHSAAAVREELISIGYQIGEPYYIAQADYVRGRDMIARAKVESGLRYLRRSHRLHLIANSRRALHSLLAIVEGLCRAERYDEAYEHSLRARTEFRRVDECALAMRADVLFVEAAAGTRRWAAVESIGVDALRDVAESGLTRWDVLRSLTAILRIAAGEAAESTLERVAPIARRYAARVGESPWHAELGELLSGSIG